MPILTPETDPNHPVVGHRFRAFSGEYICDSYDPSCGYWMTPVDPGQPYPFDANKTDRRRNVSERAIGRTFHYI